MAFSSVTFGGSGGIVNHGSNCESFGDDSGQLEANPANKGETASSSHGSKSSSTVLADHHSLRIKPETFSAASGDNWLMWMRKFKNIAWLNKWKAELQCQIWPTYLKSLARQTYYSLTAEQTPT